MNKYQVEIKFPNGSVGWMVFEARSQSEARQMGSAFGQVIIIYNAY